MKCKECAEGRRFAKGSIECLRYGMIIREDHEGTRKGCEENERQKREDRNGDKYMCAELSEDGWPDFDSMPEFLREE